MTEYDVKRLALIFAKQAEIEGMKAENLIRENQGLSLAYNENEFLNKSDDLKMLAYKHDYEL